MIRFCAEKLTAAWAVLSKGWLRTGGTLREVGAVVVIVAASLAWRLLSGGVEADAAPKAPRKAPQQTAAPVAQPAEERLVAMVNGAEISQGQLAAECLSRHGTAVLETLVNKQIISQACQRQGITVTPQDVDAEIDAMSRRFNVPRDKWIELIQQERGITSAQYAEEIVWPMIALRRLARAGIEPTPEEITKAFDNQFGPAVKARIIVVRSPAEAEKLRAQVLAAPDDFGALARQHSIDVGSASANGWVQPVRRHSGEPQFEAAVFGLEPGGISTVVQVADQFIIVKCEGHLPAAEVKLDDVRPRLAEELRERKSRAASSDVFRQLQDAAIVENIFNDPAKSAAQPGVAALVNGQPIAIDQVRDECLERHGNDVLEILVTRTILQQALEREKRQVSQAEVDAEITKAAERLGFRKPDGSADTAAWIERVTREQKLPVRHYVEDIVQPTVALKKLVGQVAVTQEDLDKAFAATFGPRARCRVIILDNQRRAQEVWQLARQSPTSERLGELAEQYSVDPASRALRGEVPPIQRHGGQPALEREAFSLKPGELSGVLQVADRFIVLFCEGFTAPAEVKFAEVRDELYDDIFEKKQRIEMARFFSHLREGATIDNFLAGTSQSPKPGGPARTSTVPKTSLTKSETEELAQPRAGSRRAAAAVPPAAGPGVVPASLDTPSGDR
ncbi:MAG: peptidylprolyl isomerase [Planctomycetota bacterium]